MPSFAFHDGRFVPEAEAVVSVFDRCFLYGDGLFEVIPFFDANPFRWEQHMERFRFGSGWLNIRPPLGPDDMRRFAAELVHRNELPDCLVRITLSRGVGRRGYSPKGAESPVLVMTTHPAVATPRLSAADTARESNPDGRQAGAPMPWKLITSSVRLPAGEPLAQFKNANKLTQILARAEADAAGADEALLLNTNGHAVEGTTSNLFWIEGGTIGTPPLDEGILPGVTRAVVFELCANLGLDVAERNVVPAELRQMEGIFFSLSSWGIVEVQSLDGGTLQSSPLSRKIRHAYWELVQAETRPS